MSGFVYSSSPQQKIPFSSASLRPVCFSSNMYALEAAAVVASLFLGYPKLVSWIVTGARGSGNDPPLRLKLCLSYINNPMVCLSRHLCIIAYHT